MKTAILILSLVGASGTAFARCPRGAPVDRLTCAQAQEFAAANGCYWVNHRDGNGSLPIYPVYSADQLNCGPNQRATPMIEETSDATSCGVAYQCLDDNGGGHGGGGHGGGGHGGGGR